MWAEPSSLYFQLAAVGAKGNIDIRFEHIDGQWNTVGLGLSPVIWGDKSSYLKLDSAETWKRNAKANKYGEKLTDLDHDYVWLFNKKLKLSLIIDLKIVK